MRTVLRGSIFLAFLAPLVSQADIVWSGCGTITSVTNYLANSNQFVVTCSGCNIPTPPSCSGIGGAPAVYFAIGSDGVTSTNITALLATALSAQASGRQVMIAYDNGTSSCYGQVISVGGYSGQCP